MCSKSTAPTHRPCPVSPFSEPSLSAQDELAFQWDIRNVRNVKRPGRHSQRGTRWTQDRRTQRVTRQRGIRGPPRGSDRERPGERQARPQEDEQRGAQAWGRARARRGVPGRRRGGRGDRGEGRPTSRDPPRRPPALRKGSRQKGPAATASGAPVTGNGNEPMRRRSGRPLGLSGQRGLPGAGPVTPARTAGPRVRRTARRRPRRAVLNLTGQSSLTPVRPSRRDSPFRVPRN